MKQFGRISLPLSHSLSDTCLSKNREAMGASDGCQHCLLPSHAPSAVFECSILCLVNILVAETKQERGDKRVLKEWH